MINGGLITETHHVGADGILTIELAGTMYSSDGERGTTCTPETDSFLVTSVVMLLFLAAAL